MSEWTTVAKVTDIPPGTVTLAEAEGVRIAVCHVEGEGLYAIEDVCTHDGGALDQGELLGCEIECPRHGARFDVRSGQPLCLPAVLPVPTFLLRVEGQEVQIQLGTPAAREANR